MSFETMAAKAFRVSSFTAVGHLLHINLKDHLLDHKFEIGQVLLKNNPRAVAVVNKINSIDNDFRNFEIEVLAKREDCDKSDEELMIVEVKENKCRFQLDFSKVYWNSRLSTEHERIINKITINQDVVFDLFAGVGPFSIPAAKWRTAKTYANDLNPESFKWLNSNFKLNKVKTDMYETTNMDAKDYILNILRPKLIEEYERAKDKASFVRPRIHIIMNLPALAPTFLPHFIGLLKHNDGNFDDSSYLGHMQQLFKELEIEHIVYCYCFLKGVYDDPKQQVKSMIEENFGRELNDDQLLDIFRVRNVSAYKDMYRVEIKLDESILFGMKNIVGIMKNSSQNKTQTNGSCKKVTIKAPKKRIHDDSTSTDDGEDDDDDDQAKRPRMSCSIM